MKKIMFNDKYGLTQAVLEGRKTQTRRIITIPKNIQRQIVGEPKITGSKDYRLGVEVYIYDEEDDDFVPMYVQPVYLVNEIVAIAQSYNSFYNDECNPNLFPNGAGWTNKMYVKPELMPHQIRITNVRAERLQDISDEDCLKEGVVSFEHEIPTRAKQVITRYYPCKYLMDSAKCIGWGRVYDTPQGAYSYLIDMISGKGTWDSNPYVFVYDFELVK